MLRSSKQVCFENFEAGALGVANGMASCFKLMDQRQKLEAIFVVVNLGESVAS